VFSQCTSLSSEKKTETVGEFSREIMDRRRGSCGFDGGGRQGLAS